MKTRSRALGAAVAACVLLALAPAAALAAPTISKLRVEADAQAVSSGALYVNDTARLATSPSECGGSGETKTVAGPSAIGLVDYAQETNRSLAPFFVSDKFDFGLIVCRVGDYGAFSASQAWLYKVDHVAPQVGGDQYPLERRDEVLWYFADFATGENTGAELDLQAPARVKPGVPFTVKVVGYDSEGHARPVEDAKVFGAASAVTGADGTTRVTLTGEGTKTLRAARGNDIPAPRTPVCVNQDIDRCPASRPELIVGTDRGDPIVGTPAPDTVLARGGDDRVDVRVASADSVRCGAGRDNVLASANDRVAADCELRNGRPRG